MENDRSCEKCKHFHLFKDSKNGITYLTGCCTVFVENNDNFEACVSATSTYKSCELFMERKCEEKI